MKKLLIIYTLLSFATVAQVKKPVSTSKKVPAKTSTVKKATTKTIVKPIPKVVAPVPAQSQTVEVAPMPVEKPTEPVGPPLTGPTTDGPKSYTEPTINSNAIKSKSKTTAAAKATKTVAPKTEKKNIDKKRSYFGIRGGYNLATTENALETFGVNSTTKAVDLPGLLGGLVINLGISNAFSIQPEILYSQQGIKVVDGANNMALVTTNVNLPLLLKIAVGSPKIKFFINAGPYIGYQLSRKIDTNVAGLLELPDYKSDYDALGEKDNRIDFGGIGGAGLQFKIGGPLLTLEGRYQYGMADPILYKNGKPAENGKQGQNRIMTGTIGILFPLGGR